jgi:LPS-assembly lipoprotein
MRIAGVARVAGVFLLALGVPLLLLACTIRPLYAPAAALGEAGPRADLPAILVDEPINREEQVFRNALLFGLRGGGDGGPAHYSLIYRMTLREREVAVERETGTPNAYQLTGDLSFLVKDISTDESLYGASVTAVDSYTRSSQNYANIRARRDAEDRLATTLAELTTARLAAFFATR